jgi:hypothetical protein
MPTITISQVLFERLQKHAIPFVDTPETTISKAFDVLEQSKGRGLRNNAPNGRGGSHIQQFDPTRPPDLTFAKLVAATFNGESIKPANWKRLLETAIIYAGNQITEFGKLQRIAAVNIVKGKKEDEGYHYLPRLDISVQGQDANAAFRGAMLLAQNLQCPFEVSFIWRNKEGAKHPGQAGAMSFG